MIITTSHGKIKLKRKVTLVMSRLKSEVWVHFTIITANEKTKCKYCKKDLSFRSGSTGNLQRHLKTVHPLMPFGKRIETCLLNELQTMETDDPLLGQSSAIVSSDNPTPAQLPEIASSFALISSSSPNIIQSKLTRFVSMNKPVSLSRRKKLDKQLALMLSTKFLPFSLVEDNNFKKFVNLLELGYSLPSRKTISNSLIPQLYDLIYAVVKKEIDNAEAICLTMDSWTSINSEYFFFHNCTFFKWRNRSSIISFTKQSV